MLDFLLHFLCKVLLFTGEIHCSKHRVFGGLWFEEDMRLCESLILRDVLLKIIV